MLYSLQRVLEQSGLTLTPRHLFSLCVACAADAGLIALLLSPIWWVRGSAMLLAFPVPLLFVAVRREQRLCRLRCQLPDAFEMMSRSIRAGQTVTRSFQTVADDFESPISDEFAWCFEQQNLGLPQDVALRDLARRCGVAELQMLVVALLVQRQSGGSSRSRSRSSSAGPRTTSHLDQPGPAASTPKPRGICRRLRSRRSGWLPMPPSATTTS